MVNENDNQIDVQNHLLEEKSLNSSNEDTSEEFKEIEEDFEDFDDYEVSGEEQEQIHTTVSNKAGRFLLLLIPIVLVLLAGGFFAFKFIKGSTDVQNVAKDEIPVVEISENQEDISNSFFNGEAGENEDSGMMNVNFNDNGETAVVSDDLSQDEAATVKDVVNVNKEDNLSENSAEENSKDSVMISWNGKSRQNPFKPPLRNSSTEERYEKFGDVQFEIVEPPTKLVPDENLTKLLQTQISGILYDEESPSAIVNLAGKDEFVKIGDEISGYKIRNITRNKVEISYKNNTYVASVGELFSPGKLETQRAVANLSSKFAGRYKSVEE